MHAITRRSKISGVSIVVPTLNEQGSVRQLVERIDVALRTAGREYEIVFVDDHSTDATTAILESLMTSYPIQLASKRGLKGKAFSLLEGFELARYDLIATIDADLQYPPEAIPSMLIAIDEMDADIVLTRRITNETGWLRRMSSATFKFVFVKLLFNLDYDTQSALKLFRTSILSDLDLKPTPWSFDLEFIVNSKSYDARIISQDIVFEARKYDEAKISLVAAAGELAASSLKLRVSLIKAKLFENSRTNESQ
jgi:glycosyltransferase involved in cell wall biosynthesis